MSINPAHGSSFNLSAHFSLLWNLVQQLSQGLFVKAAGTRAGGKQRITLNSADKTYAELRDLSFAAVGPQLRQRAMAIQSDYKTSKVLSTCQARMSPCVLGPDAILDAAQSMLQAAKGCSAWGCPCPYNQARPHGEVLCEAPGFHRPLIVIRLNVALPHLLEEILEGTRNVSPSQGNHGEDWRRQPRGA